jgi:hypothetical protein
MLLNAKVELRACLGISISAKKRSSAYLRRYQTFQIMQPQYQRLTDNQWEVIKQYLNWQRKRTLSLRDIVDAILYRTGLQWRSLSETKFPPWQVVYYYFYKWSKEGVFEKYNTPQN